MTDTATTDRADWLAWRRGGIAAADDQRYHLEVLIGDVQVDHKHRVRWGQR